MWPGAAEEGSEGLPRWESAAGSSSGLFEAPSWAHGRWAGADVGGAGVGSGHGRGGRSAVVAGLGLSCSWGVLLKYVVRQVLILGLRPIG